MLCDVLGLQPVREGHPHKVPERQHEAEPLGGNVHGGEYRWLVPQPIHHIQQLKRIDHQHLDAHLQHGWAIALNCWGRNLKLPRTIARYFASSLIVLWGFRLSLPIRVVKGEARAILNVSMYWGMMGRPSFPATQRNSQLVLPGTRTLSTIAGPVRLLTGTTALDSATCIAHDGVQACVGQGAQGSECSTFSANSGVRALAQHLHSYAALGRRCTRKAVLPTP